MHDILCVRVSACMNVCLSVYMPPRGAEACVLTVSGVRAFNLPLLQLSLRRSYENGSDRQRERKLFLNNNGQPDVRTMPLT